MKTTFQTASEKRYFNQGLARGRVAQTRQGMGVPNSVYMLDAAEQKAYLNGWQLGNTTVTTLSLLLAR